MATFPNPAEIGGMICFRRKWVVLFYFFSESVRVKLIPIFRKQPKGLYNEMQANLSISGCHVSLCSISWPAKQGLSTFIFSIWGSKESCVPGWIEGAYLKKVGSPTKRQRILFLAFSLYSLNLQHFPNL